MTSSPDEGTEIPLLEDVVEPGQPPAAPEPPAVTMPGYRLPAPGPLIDKLRESLRRQLEQELDPLIRHAVDIAVKEATRDLSQIIHEQLSQGLQQRINLLIHEELERRFGK